MQVIKSGWRNEELNSVQELARHYFQKEVLPNIPKHVAQGHPDRSLYRRAGELGLLCMSIPQEYGGGGGTFAHDAVLIEEQSRAGDVTMSFGVQNLASHYVLAYASESQKKQWLPKLASGEWIAAVAMTEPGTGSDLQAIATRAMKDNDFYRVRGSKIFITNGHLCDFLIIVVRTSDVKGATGLSLLVAEVSNETPGFKRGRILDKIGCTGQDTAELFFDDLVIPTANILGGKEGYGFNQIMQQLPRERLFVALIAQIVLERAVDLTVAYTKERQAFGGTLFELQNTRFELAECATLAHVGRLFVDDCIQRYLREEFDVPTAAMAKYWLTDQTCIVIDRCLQLFGGYGYMKEYPIAHLFTDTRVLRILAGANEVMKELVARSL